MRLLSRIFLSAALASPVASQATWLDLPDGVYDLTLSCAYSSNAAPCTAPFHVSLTIDGSGASAMSATFNNEVFSGDPTDGSGTTAAGTFQNAVLTNTPFSGFGLVYDVGGSGFPGLSDHWWGYCINVAVNECSPAANGDWVATAVSPVPEPSTTALIALGLAGMAVVKRRRAGGAADRAP